MNITNFRQSSSIFLTSTLLGLATTLPAQAIALKYVVSGGNLSDGGTLSGDFTYDSATTTYSAFNLTVSASPENTQQTLLTYTLLNSTLSSATSTGFRLTLSSPAPLTSRFLAISFASPLASSVGGTTNISPGIEDDDYSPSRERTASGTVIQLRGVNSGASVTAVPFESDVLPLLGATALFAGGVWWKRRRGNGAVNFESEEG